MTLHPSRRWHRGFIPSIAYRTGRKQHRGAPAQNVFYRSPGDKEELLLGHGTPNSLIILQRSWPQWSTPTPYLPRLTNTLSLQHRRLWAMLFTHSGLFLLYSTVIENKILRTGYGGSIHPLKVSVSAFYLTLTLLIWISGIPANKQSDQPILFLNDHLHGLVGYISYAIWKWKWIFS